MYCHILRVRAIPTLESTDSMIESTDSMICKYLDILPSNTMYSNIDRMHLKNWGGLQHPFVYTLALSSTLISDSNMP